MTVQPKGEKNWPTDLGPRLRVGLVDALHMSGRAIVRRIQINMRKPKSGRIYGGHQASAPGEYSAVKTGDLINSTNYRVSGVGYLTIYATSPHAGYQERGTWKMAARLNLIRGIQESEGEVRSVIDICVRRALRVR